MIIKRKTIQQTLVFDTVNELNCHVTADEVYDMVVKNHPSISKGTVYRNLNQLAKGGQIRKVEVVGGADRFEHQCHNHYHTKCLKCGQIFDVDMEYIEDLEKTIKLPYGFQFSSHDIIFKGTCSKCVE